MSARILHVLESARPSPGSVAISLGGLFAEVQRRGWQAAFAAEDPDETGFLAQHAITFTCDQARGLALADFDVVHVHGWGYDLARAAASAARKLRKPYLISPGGAATDAENGLWRRLYWRFVDGPLFRRAKWIGAVNPFEQASLAEAGWNENVRVLPYGADFAALSKGSGAGPAAPIPDQSRKLVVMGEVDSRSGCVALLKALAEVGPDADGWQVVLCGSCGDQWKKALQAAVTRKGAEDRVLWVQADGLEQQRKLLAGAGLFVSPSPRVRPPVAVVQAIAAGVPVLATQCSAPPELDSQIDVCEAGRSDLREALRRILRTPALRRRERAQEARARAATVLDWPHLADRYLEVYESVASSAR